MNSACEHFSLKARPRLRVPLQGATDQGTAKEAGVEYADPEKGGVRGPYETGCEEGRKCFEISMQQRLTGLVARVRLESLAPLSGLVGWWRADALQNLADGERLASWPASLGGYPLKPLGTVCPTFRKNRVNGLPAAGSTYEEFGEIGMAMQTGYHYAGTGQGRQMLLVCRISDFAYGFLAMRGRVYTSGLHFDGWFPPCFSELYVSGDDAGCYLNTEVAERSTDWCIVSLRFALTSRGFSLRSNGSELRTQLGLAGSTRLAREIDDAFFIHLGIEYGDAFEVAEILAWNRALEDREIQRAEKYLAEKYAIALEKTL